MRVIIKVRCWQQGLCSKSLNNNYLERELSSKFDANSRDYAAFEGNFVNVLINMHLNAQSFSGNHKPHVSKTLRLAIMKHYRLKNKANKTQLPSDKQNYKKNKIWSLN